MTDFVALGVREQVAETLGVKNSCGVSGLAFDEKSRSSV
jgi:hypothetical protein